MLSLLSGSQASAAFPRKRNFAVVRATGAKDERPHIPAPFDLCDNMDVLDEPDNRAFFNTVFVGNAGYATDALFLYIYLDTPPQPVPKSFAGVPVVFVPPETGPVPEPPPFVMPIGFWVPLRQGSIAADLDYRDRHGSDWQPLFDKIRLHFDDIKVPITEVIYWGPFVHIVLEHADTDKEKLPCQAGNIICRYFFETEMKRPSMMQARQRAKNPTRTNVVDDTIYDVLQPGVMVSSDYLPGSQEFLSTTLGTRVQDAAGHDYITVAAHGFPNACGVNVYQGLREGGRLVGRLVRRIGTTDVALVRLDANERFHNETFVCDLTEGQPSLLRGLRRPKRYDVVSLDSPETGYMEGQVMAHSYMKIPSDGDADEQNWVATSWLYQAPNAGELPFRDSMCGTVVCDKDKQVVSFFQYVFTDGPWKNWCVGTSAEELLKRGFF